MVPPTDGNTDEQFDTFVGVIRPTLLTTLGALLFLREGWLVGNSGLLGAIVVILCAYVITGTTSLSVASLATNVRVQAGGAFALISRALGLEAGGAIGIPLYAAQCASAALYLFAFAEAWRHAFPDHPTAAVVLTGFVGVAGLTLKSANVAFKAQAPLLVLVVFAVLSAWLGGWGSPDTLPEVDPTLERVSLQEAFAVFFPAATGLMVGVGMSGSLARPRHSIPRGILTAWCASLTVYLITACWLSAVAEPDELLANKTIMISKAAFGPLVLVGVLCTTIMAAVSNMVAAPRLLQAMAAQRVVPFGNWIERPDEAGQPRRALSISLVMVGAFLLSGSLDQIAKIVTAFFILTYMAINLVVFLEQRLGMISFRPTLAVHSLVPPMGLAVCAVGLFVSSPTMGLMGVTLVVLTYVWLQKRQLHTPWETVRSGIHVRVAAWAAQRASLAGRPERAWAPEVLLPSTSTAEADLLMSLAGPLTRRAGSIRLVALGTDHDLGLDVEDRAVRARQQGRQATATSVEARNFAMGSTLVVDALRGMFLGPNLVIASGEHQSEKDLQVLLDHCERRGTGVGILLAHPDGGIGRAKQVSVWLSERSPHWNLEMHNVNLDLPVLTGHLLSSSDDHALQLCTVVRSIDDRADANAFLQRLIDQGRLSKRTKLYVSEDEFMDALKASPYADLHIFGLSTTVEMQRLFKIRDACGGACVFLLDSGQESILA